MEVGLSYDEDVAPVEDRDVARHENVDFNTQSRTMEYVDEGDQATQVRSRILFDHLFCQVVDTA
jgi:hypothetical protein